MSIFCPKKLLVLVSKMKNLFKIIFDKITSSQKLNSVLNILFIIIHRSRKRLFAFLFFFSRFYYEYFSLKYTINIIECWIFEIYLHITTTQRVFE